MNPDAPDLEEIFSAARERPDPSARAAYLDEVCGSDARLRNRVERLLAADPLVDGFLEAPAPPPTPLPDFPPAEALGAVVGPYKLLETLGEGGMGVVHRAEQTAPVRREVALKLIRPGLDTPQVVARFEAERQALALMDHPNIPRVLEAGSTSAGRPYFVMELVRGAPITEHCEANRLTVEERLGLFSQVCDAVRHAHQKGVIHRDVKPANVLVRAVDGVSTPTVIDFGIAKSTGPALTDAPLRTAAAQWFGSPLYMSPEQAAMDGTDVDTRSDVYSLGVMLYELLTGTTPFDAESFRGRSFDEVRRVLLERDPPPPSARLAASGAALAAVAANRRVEPARLVRLVRGDLDWIVMKAMEKDRRRRYESVGELADDVARRLKNLPVEAGPPSRRYRALKFARRNRVALTTASLVGLALVSATAVSVRQALWATAAESRTSAALEAAKRSRFLAERHLVAAGLRQAADAVGRRQFERAQEVLESLRPAPGEPDHRGFAWSYLRRLARRELRLFQGHEPDMHRATALSPDGRLFATSGPAGSVILWDVAAERRRATLKGHALGVVQLVFSADGRRLASVATFHDRAEIRVWDVESGGLTARLDPPPGELLARASFAVSGDRIGVFLESPGGRDRRIEVYDLSGEGPGATHVRTAPLSPEAAVRMENGVVAGVSPSGVVVVFDLADLDRRWSPPERDAGLKFVVLSRDGRRLTLEDGRDLALYDVPAGARLGRGRFARRGHTIETPVPSSDGSKLLVHYKPDQLALYEVKDSAFVSRREIPIGPPDVCELEHAEFSPDGSKLAVQTRGVRGGSDTLTVHDVATGRVRNVYPGRRGGLSEVVFSPDGRSILLHGGGYVRRWILDPTENEPPDVLAGHSDEAWAVAVSPDGRAVATGSDDTDEKQTIKIFDAETGKSILSWNGGRGTVASLAHSPRGDLLVSSHLAREANLRFWDARTGRHTATLTGHAAFVRSAAFSPDGAWLASGDDAGVVRIWNGATGAFVRELVGHTDKVRRVAFAPDSLRLLTAGNDGTARIWDVADGRPIHVLGGAEHFAAVAFAPDGATIAAADEEGSIVIWNAATGAVVRRIQSEEARFLTLAYSPDGRALAASGEGRTIRLWDPSTGQDLLGLEGHRAQVNAVAFTSDGDALVSCDHEGVVRFWRAKEPPEPR